MSLKFSENYAAGAGIAAFELQSEILLYLVARGQIPKSDAIELIDAALSNVEKREARIIQADKIDQANQLHAARLLLNLSLEAHRFQDGPL